MTHLPAPHRITRRSFCTLSAVALASLALPARRAFGDEAATAATATQPGAIVIVHTNDVHCAVDDNLGYAKLVNYAKTMRSTYGADNVTLVDAGDAVQGKAMGTLTDGEYLVDIMNECGYDFAIPGNHEFDYGMAQFNTLVARANAKYLSCNFTDLRTGNLMFDAYAMREYGTGADTKKVAFLGICTPESLTKSSPAHFQEGGTYRYGFCEDDSGAKLYDAVQRAVDQARADGADYVVALAHLGQGGVTPRWTSAAVAANTSGIDVIIDGHSHELYVQTPLNKNGQPVLVTQTGTQLVGIGQVVINPRPEPSPPTRRTAPKPSPHPRRTAPPASSRLGTASMPTRPPASQGCKRISRRSPGASSGARTCAWSPSRTTTTPGPFARTRRTSATSWPMRTSRWHGMAASWPISDS